MGTRGEQALNGVYSEPEFLIMPCIVCSLSLSPSRPWRPGRGNKGESGGVEMATSTTTTKAAATMTML